MNLARQYLRAKREMRGAGLDAGIAHAVYVMRAGGFETFQSCQGGRGHSYPAATIEFHGDLTEGFRAFAWARTNRLRVAEIEYVWETMDDYPGSRPCWRMVFYKHIVETKVR